MNYYKNNELILAKDVKDSMLNPQYSHTKNKCNGCGVNNPKYFNEKYQLFVCGGDKCKPYDISMDIFNEVFGR